MSTVFHPQTDGVTKRVNRSIGQILQSIIRDEQKDWAIKCPIVKLTLNGNVSATTGFTPFELNHSYMPRIDLPVNTDTTFKGVSQFTQQARWSLMAAHNAILEHRIDQTVRSLMLLVLSQGQAELDQCMVSSLPRSDGVQVRLTGELPG
jgi:hypothetical protein